MKKIFILGASILQVPAIKKAKEKGLYVYVLDYNCDAVGVKFADEFLCISTIDKEAVYQAALLYNPDFIITSTSDMPVQTVAWVNEKLGKKSGISYADAICATNKVAMRQRMKKCGISIPQFYCVKEREQLKTIVQNMPEQFVVKPADNAASRGVILVNKMNRPDYDEIFNFAHRYSRSGEILVEEFMEGPEVSVESFTVNGKTNIIAITDKIVTETPFFVELGHTQPSCLEKETIVEIEKLAKDAIKALQVKNGPTHTEIKITPDGVKLVEIAARLGGDFITSQLVPLSTGIDMVECSLASILGEQVQCDRKFTKGAAIRFIQAKQGVYSHVRGMEVAKCMLGVQEAEIYKNPGDIISCLKSSADRVGHIIAVGNNAQEASGNCENALKKITVEVTEAEISTQAGIN